MSGPRASGRHRLEEFNGTERFEVVSRLGSGGMGVVYEVRDHGTGSRVALKTLSFGDPTSIYRFKKEFRGLSDISHPNLVALYELMAGDDQWFFTMELVPGTDLRNYLFNRSAPQNAIATERLAEESLGAEIPISNETLRWPVDMELLRMCMSQLAEGLHALHSHGRLHRDIKPSNVLVTKKQRVVLVDFGLSTEVAEIDAMADVAVVGTLAYMSPEQAVQEALSPASDWYAVGCVLYELLTGRLPFVGRGDKVLMRKQAEDPVDPRQIEPNIPDDLGDLCMALLHRDPNARPTGVEVLHRLGAGENAERVWHAEGESSHPEVFIGRAAPLARLAESLRVVNDDGTPQCVLVHGSPGIGKSALLRRFTNQAYHELEATVLMGRCYERESVPFKAVDTIVDALSRHLGTLQKAEVADLLPEHTYALTRLFPVLNTVRSIARLRGSRNALDPQVSRRLGLVALRNLLGSLASRQPLILCIDDFQWSDEDSAVFLASLLGSGKPPAILLLIGYRRDDVETSKALQVLLERLGEPSTSGDCVSLPLERLSRDEATELTLASFGGLAGPQRESILERVATESHGSPFFVEEMMRYLRGQAGGDSAGIAGETISLRQTMLARVDALSAKQRKLLDVVAVAGAPITEEIAFRASGFAVNDGTVVSALRAGRLVRSNREGIIAKLESYHDRIRELLVETIDPKALQETYLALAGAFEASAPSDVETIADFFDRAGDVDRAAKYAITAADRAMDALAFKRAALFFRMALRAELDVATVLQLRVKLAEALNNAGQGEAAAEAHLEVARIAPASMVLDHHRKAAESLMRAGHVDRAVELFRDVLASVGLSFSASNWRAFFNLLRWRIYLRIRGYSFRERAESEFRQEELIKVDVCGSCGLAFGVSDSIRGAEFQSRQVALALRAGEPGRVGIGLAVEAAYRALEGQKGRASAQGLIARSRALGRQVGDPVVEGFAQFSEANSVYQCGEWRLALQHFDASALILKRDCRGHQAGACQAERLAADALFFLGEIRTFSERVPSILQAAEERGDLHGVTDMRTGSLNCAWLVRDRPQQARVECERGEKQWSERRFFLQHYYVALAHINIDIYERNGRKALERCDAMWGPLRRSFLLRVAVVGAQASFLQGRALIAAAAMESSDARRPLLKRATKVAKKLRRQSIPCSSPWGALLLGQVAALQGDTASASSHLREAQKAFEGEEMMLCYHACSSLLGRLLENDEGDEMRSAATRWALGQGVVDPERFLRIMAPLL